MTQTTPPGPTDDATDDAVAEAPLTTDDEAQRDDLPVRPGNS